MKRAMMLLLGIMLLSACEPVINSGGHVADETVESQIITGMTSKRDIVALLGSPSAMSDYGDDTWYYVRTTKEQKAFFKPEITNQQVMQVHFDAGGLVEKVDHYSLEDGKRIEIAEKETPTEGHSLGFFEQILGNVGRFNQGPPGAPAGR